MCAAARHLRGPFSKNSPEVLSRGVYRGMPSSAAVSGRPVEASHGLAATIYKLSRSALVGSLNGFAGVAELADAQDLKSWILRGVRVQLPPPA